MNIKNGKILKGLILLICFFLFGSASLYKIKSEKISGTDRTLNTVLIAKDKSYGGNIKTEITLGHIKSDGVDYLSLQFKRESLNAQLARNHTIGSGAKHTDFLLSGKVSVNDSKVTKIIDLELGTDRKVSVLNKPSGLGFINDTTIEILTIPIDEKILKTLFSEERTIRFDLKPVNSKAYPTSCYIGVKNYKKVVKSINQFYQKFYNKELGL